ncbi:isopentenyl-diphosphate Delta-isomerase [Nocardioides sp.]|uniref:isopentenyl-diphosphate Delta-isomerase n=1 Tax=Nocardioides sp. TaxID=35761 RepID=UPI003D100D28
MSAVESVVLLDEEGRAIGVADKAGVHHRDTPLHLAFSCYLFDAAGRLLVTRRALHKKTFPGVWTNSCCGHPAPGEDIVETVRRRVGQELGVRVDDVRLVIPEFRYRAVMPDGVVENEMCPVFVATTAEPICADPDEVEDHEWVDWSQFRSSVLSGSREVSHWCVLQVRALPLDPLTAVARPRDLLPPAAR